MAVNLVTVTGNLETLIGATPSLGRIWFKLNRPDWNLAGNIFAPEFVEAVAGSSGSFTVDLQSTDPLEAGAFYSAVLRYNDVVTGKVKEYTLGQFFLPTGGPFALSTLLVVPFVQPVPADILALVTAFAAAADADRIAAAASASSADADRIAAEAAAAAASAAVASVDVDAIARSSFRLDEYEEVAANFVQPDRRLMPIGDSFIFASDDSRKTIHYCLSVGTYRINCSSINLGCRYTIIVGPNETIRPTIESGPGLSFVGQSVGRLGLNATAIELQSGECIEITKVRNNELVVVSSVENADRFFATAGSPAVESLYVQQPDGKYTLHHTRTLNANQVQATTPTHSTRTMDFAGALTIGSVVVDAVAGSVIPFKVGAHAAGASITIVNPNAATARCTITIRDIEWVYT
jgi:hypothetical protein